ncbi:MAG: response regulator [Nitrospirae bacterium]|nr:response regulator [Nitrospirota bacterium]
MAEKIILLVEDNPDDEALTVRALKKHHITSKIVVARDGAEALDYLFGAGAHAGRDTSRMPVLIFLDLQLPGINGIEVLKRIRGNHRTKFIPVVILTGSAEDRHVAESYRVGVNSFIQKPAEFKAFAEAVWQIGHYWLMINRPAPAAGS